MYTPQTYLGALGFVIFSMFCWGSWPNFLKAMPKWRLEYFYLDYAFGFLITGLAIAATFGSTVSVVPGSAFLVRLAEAGRLEAGCAVLGGFLWSLGNVLMVNSIMIAGLAVAFPVTSIPAMVLGVGIAYWAQPIGNPLWLSASVVVLLLAGFANARAYGRLGNPVEADKPRGVKLALLAGIMVGIFPPCVGRAISGAHALDSYTVSIYFMLGALLATLVAVPTLLAHPLVGSIGKLRDYWHGKMAWHLLGLLAGFVWSFGTVFNFLSAKTVGMAISWGIGSGANMVGALWGIFLWREFAHGDSRAKALIAISLALYAVGVTGVALAYNGS
jgi:glucose uptake protein